MKQLNDMLHDERMAPKQYARLSKQLKKKGDKQIIQGIVRQEREHYKKLEKIKRRLK
jgi:rubrerythrin